MSKDGLASRFFSSISSNGANVAKIIATLCVVFVHSDNIFGYAKIEDVNLKLLRGFVAISTAGVPIFFLLSGYFLMLKDDWNWKKNLRKKVKTLLIPYCCFITVYTIMNCIGYNIAPTIFDNYKAFCAKDWLERIIGCPFLVPVIKKCSGWILLPVLATIWFSPIHSFARQATVFFIMGMYFGGKVKLPIIRKPVILTILFGIGFVLPIVVPGDHSLQFASLLMILSILSISELSIASPRIQYYSHLLITFSFPVYLVHGYLLTLMQRVIVWKVNINFLSATILYMLLPAVVVALCILYSSIWKKVLPKTYAIFIGGR